MTSHSKNLTAPPSLNEMTFSLTPIHTKSQMYLPTSAWRHLWAYPEWEGPKYEELREVMANLE